MFSVINDHFLGIMIFVGIAFVVTISIIAIRLPKKAPATPEQLRAIRIGCGIMIGIAAAFMVIMIIYAGWGVP